MHGGSVRPPSRLLTDSAFLLRRDRFVRRHLLGYPGLDVLGSDRMFFAEILAEVNRVVCAQGKMLARDHRRGQQHMPHQNARQFRRRSS